MRARTNEVNIDHLDGWIRQTDFFGRHWRTYRFWVSNLASPGRRWWIASIRQADHVLDRCETHSRSVRGQPGQRHDAVVERHLCLESAPGHQQNGEGEVQRPILLLGEPRLCDRLSTGV